MRDFALLAPSSVREASQMLADLGEEARLFAGGTALLLAMRQRMLNPTHVIYLGRLTNLSQIEYDNRNGLKIGALVHHAAIATNDIIRSKYPMLADMAGQIA